MREVVGGYRAREKEKLEDADQKKDLENQEDRVKIQGT